MATYKGKDINLKPTATMAEEAQRGLDWRKEHGRGGTEVGVARARQLVNRQELSPDTVRRMVSYFARHEVDKEGEGFSPDEDGYPSAGRIAWALWGGDAGKSWANEKDRVMDRIDDEERGWGEERPYPNEHAARINEPDQYDDFRREADAGGSGIDFIYGIVDNTSEIQSIRFDADRYTEAESREWLDDHDFEPIKFEPAIGERGDDMENIEENIVEDNVEEVTEDVARFDRSEMVQRAIGMQDTAIDTESRTVRVGVSSEEPVKRSFGLEVIDHRTESMNLEFLNSGRAPLLMDHDMERQIGVVESVELDENARRLRAIVRFGRGELASEVFNDVVDGIRQNISVMVVLNVKTIPMSIIGWLLHLWKFLSFQFRQISQI